MEKRRLWSPPEIKAVLLSSFKKLQPTLNYFWFHFFFFVIVSLFLGVLFWSIETDLNFMDALFLATSTFCNVGLVTVDFSEASLTTQILVYIFLHFGGFILISVIPLLVRIASVMKHPSRPTPYPRKPYIRGLLLLAGFIIR
jgi:Trk-type K+ transport system membrane component